METAGKGYDVTGVERKGTRRDEHVDDRSVLTSLTRHSRLITFPSSPYPSETGARARRERPLPVSDGALRAEGVRGENVKRPIRASDVRRGRDTCEDEQM